MTARIAKAVASLAVTKAPKGVPVIVMVCAPLAVPIEFANKFIP